MKLIFLKESTPDFKNGEEYESFWETKTTYLFHFGKYIVHSDKILKHRSKLEKKKLITF